jgi:hypothetical protein
MLIHRSLPILKTIAYVMAALVLLCGLIVGFSLLAGSANLHDLLLPFQLMGSDVFANLITPYLRSLLNGLGIATLVISFAISLLLFIAGRLLGHNAALEARLARLEARV